MNFGVMKAISFISSPATTELCSGTISSIGVSKETNSNSCVGTCLPQDTSVQLTNWINCPKFGPRPSPQHGEGAPHPGGIHGFGHMEANYPFPHFSIHFHSFLLLIPGNFGSISTLSTWDEEQTSQQRFNPSQGREDGINPRQGNVLSPGSGDTSLLMASLQNFQLPFPAQGTLIFLQICSPAQLTEQLPFALSDLCYGKQRFWSRSWGIAAPSRWLEKKGIFFFFMHFDPHSLRFCIVPADKW